MKKCKPWVDDLQTCVVCGSPYVEIHHVFGGYGRRKLSDKYGYIIPLCQEHHTGNTGIHFDRILDIAWKRKAQMHWEQTRTREDFIKVFGRNYL